MLFSIRQLLAGRAAPLCVSREMLIKDALAQMIEHNYSQLPVVDHEGSLLGLVSEKGLIRTCFHLQNSTSLTELKVGQCLTNVETLLPDDDLFRALDRLEQEYAVVVVEGSKPIGILTDYDTTHFFREFSEGLILIQDIELTLRQSIERAFPDGASLTEALIFAFGVDKKDGKQPAKTYQELTLGEHVQLITTEQNWMKFQPIFESKALFLGWMEPARKIRNQLTHFRGQVTKTQLDALERALDWMSHCPKLPLAQVARLERQPTPVAITAPETPPKKQGKYDPLREWLGSLDAKEKAISLTLEGIEHLLGEPLPPSSTHRSWWANDRVGHRQSIAWLGAGWRVEEVDFTTQQVTFHRITDATAADEEGTL